MTAGVAGLSSTVSYSSKKLVRRDRIYSSKFPKAQYSTTTNALPIVHDMKQETYDWFIMTGGTRKFCVIILSESFEVTAPISLIIFL